MIENVCIFIGVISITSTYYLHYPYRFCYHFGDKTNIYQNINKYIYTHIMHMYVCSVYMYIHIYIIHMHSIDHACLTCLIEFLSSGLRGSLSI